MAVAIPLLLYNCETDEFFQEPQLDLKEMSFTTVSINDAKLLFNSYSSSLETVSSARSETPLLEINPNWETVTQSDLDFTDALLTNVEADINRDGTYKTKLFFLTINDSTLQALETEYATERFENGAIKTGIVYYNNLSGIFLDAYIINNGLANMRLVPNQTANHAGMFSFINIFFQSDTNYCWNTDNLPGDGLLTEVIITIGQPMSEFMAVYEESGEFNPGTNNGNNYGSGGGAGGSDPNANADTGECNEGYEFDPGLGICIEINTPCSGDPLPIIKLAHQLGVSGWKGGMFGNSNSAGGCTRYGANDCTTPRNKKHDGLDLESSFGDPIYAMYSGFIYSTKHDEDGAGYYTRIQSTVNGNTFLVEYFHMQEQNRILQGNPLVYVNAGDIIGYQGISGNLGGAIKNKTAVSHLHIEVREHDGTNSWGYGNFNTLVDPRSYLSTTIDNNGVSQSSTNCN